MRLMRLYQTKEREIENNSFNIYVVWEGMNHVEAQIQERLT